MLIDSHAHLCDAKYSRIVEQIIAEASQTGVKKIVDVGYNRETIERSTRISAQYDSVFSAFGFHPHDAKSVTVADIEWLLEQLGNPKCAAVGEIGLDGQKEYSPMPVQIEILEKILDAVKDTGKPVVLHSRGREEEVLDRVSRAGIQKAVFHCYTGDLQTARKIIDRGYYLSFTGIITFPKARPDWLGKIPSDRIMLETDCPYLAPVPKRGKINKPSYLPYICQRAADLYGISTAEMAEITTRNCEEFYRI